MKHERGEAESSEPKRLSLHVLTVIVLGVLIGAGVLLYRHTRSWSSSGADDCERAVRKAAPLMFERSAGDRRSSEQAAITDCRERLNPKRFTATSQQRFVNCVHAADDEPELSECLKASRPDEATEVLNRISHAAGAVFEKMGAFPSGFAQTPKLGQGCTVATIDWTESPWKDLSIDLDGPFGLQLVYHSDGRTLDVRAIVDRDCDSQTIEYVLHGESENGRAVVTVRAPPPNSD